jgi:hypothetical protein
MEATPSWESSIRLDTQKFSNMFWNLKAQCRVHKDPSLVIIVSQINPVHVIPHYFSNICSYIIFPVVWSSGQSSWLQIQRSGLDSRRYQLFWEVVGLEQLRDLYSSPSIIRVIKSRRMRWAGNVAPMGEKRNAIGYWWESRRERDH